MIDVANEDVPGRFLLLEMTFQAKRCIAFVEQSLVHGAVGRMADHTALTQGLMFVNKRPALLSVALETSFVSAQESKSAGSERLLNVRAATFDGDSLVWIVTIAAAHFSFQHRVMMRQLELCAHLEVTLETSLRRFPRIDDRVRRAATLDVQTAWPVARLAPHVRGRLYSCAALCLTGVYDFSFCPLQSRMGRCAKVAHDLFVAGRALL